MFVLVILNHCSHASEIEWRENVQRWNRAASFSPILPLIMRLLRSICLSVPLYSNSNRMQELHTRNGNMCVCVIVCKCVSGQKIQPCQIDGIAAILTMVIKGWIRKISWFYYSLNNGNMLIKTVISYLSIGCIDEFSSPFAVTNLAFGGSQCAKYTGRFQYWALNAYVALNVASVPCAQMCDYANLRNRLIAMAFMSVDTLSRQSDDDSDDTLAQYI